MGFFDTTFLDQQIDIARSIADGTLYTIFWGSVAYFTYQFVDGLDYCLPAAAEAVEPESEQPAPESVPLPTTPGSTEVEFLQGADEWEETLVKPREGWKPSTQKPATSLEDILAPQPPEEEPLAFDDLKTFSIRQLKKLASGRIKNYAKDPKETLAQKLSGKVTFLDLAVLA